MKQLQNNFTTPEQSRRLLELGLPADSADQVYYDDILWGAHEFIPNDKTYSEIVAGCENLSLPCWSVGRLIEIELICRAPQEGMIPRLSFIYGNSSENGLSSGNLIESLVTYLEVGQYNYDFSKLEE